MQGVWGTLVEMWSRRITSDTRTTTGPTSLAGGSARRARVRLIGDVKFKDPGPLFHNVEDMFGRRGAFVGFGATPRCVFVVVFVCVCVCTLE